MLYNETLQSIDKRIDTVQTDLSTIISEIHEKDSNSLAALQAANDAFESLCTVREYISLLQLRNTPNSSKERRTAMESKLWKVVVTVAQSNAEGTQEISRHTCQKFFDNVDAAEFFSKHGDIEEHDHWSSVVRREIWEYNIESIRQLKQTTKDVIEQMVTHKTVWE